MAAGPPSTLRRGGRHGDGDKLSGEPAATPVRRGSTGHTAFRGLLPPDPVLGRDQTEHLWPQATSTIAVDIEQDDRVEADVATGAVRPILTRPLRRAPTAPDAKQVHVARHEGRVSGQRQALGSVSRSELVVERPRSVPRQAGPTSCSTMTRTSPGSTASSAAGRAVRMVMRPSPARDVKLCRRLGHHVKAAPACQSCGR